MKIFLNTLLLVCLIGQANALVGNKLLEKAWFVLPWESIQEHKNNIRIHDINKLVSFENLTEIKKSKLQDPLIQNRVYAAFRAVWKKWPEAIPVDQNEWPRGVDLQGMFRNSLKEYMEKNNGNITPVDFFWVHVQVRSQRSVKTVCIAIPRINIDSACLYCCALSCFAGCMAVTCWVCGQALSEAF